MYMISVMHDEDIRFRQTNMDGKKVEPIDSLMFSVRAFIAIYNSKQTHLRMVYPNGKVFNSSAINWTLFLSLYRISYFFAGRMPYRRVMRGHFFMSIGFDQRAECASNRFYLWFLRVYLYSWQFCCSHHLSLTFFSLVRFVLFDENVGQ